MQIQSRESQNLRLPKYVNRITRSDYYFIHHSAGPITQTVQQIQNFHMGYERDWSDIAYSHLVNWKGQIFEGRGWGVVGGSTKGYNSRSHSVCYIGNTEIADITDEAKASILWLVDQHEAIYGNRNVQPHRLYSNTGTLCPGKGMFAWWKAGLHSPDSVGYVPRESWPLVNTDPTFTILGQGDDGIEVVKLQQMLKNLGYDTAVDGDFGPKTSQAVSAYQGELYRAGIYNGVVDGIWGPKSANSHNEAQKLSVEFNEDGGAKIEAAYKEYLGRSATSSELSSWVESLVVAKIDSVISFIKNSDEAKAKDTKLASFKIQNIYTDQLGRAATQKDVAYWLNKVQSSEYTWGGVRSFLATSDEAVNRNDKVVEFKIASIFLDILKRKASSDDIVYWMTKIKSGEYTWEDFTRFLKNSDEAKFFADTNPGPPPASQTPDDILTRLAEIQALIEKYDAAIDSAEQHLVELDQAFRELEAQVGARNG